MGKLFDPQKTLTTSRTRQDNFRNTLLVICSVPQSSVPLKMEVGTYEDIRTIELGNRRAFADIRPNIPLL
ncbi:hypothetical protein Y1Q_0003194 [Alligator mississippiensis]|uniref:Uncharacterized protein n=1 Tax=Alligator mississippiensis TaxID=8496 RepID=A0A151MDS6_ALLMI|nr:hypothetical protein Y1Q_0003194 [Alligator mississippiensis]